MAASALNYNRSNWHHVNEDATYYYPVYDNIDNNDTNERVQLHKGHFRNSVHNSFLPPSFDRFNMDFKFENYRACASTTPLGHMIVSSRGGQVIT